MPRRQQIVGGTTTKQISHNLLMMFVGLGQGCSKLPPHYSKNFGHKVGTLQKCPVLWKGRAQTKAQAQAGRPGRMSKRIDTSGLYFFFSYV